MPAAVIRKLPVSLVNRIAAGEVIERPASVVKELVENSIDAGSTLISVDIEDGGLGLIRVVDDGSGIAPDQLPLALAEHATSKLASDEDLFRIATKGFRGEAVASIAAVSHFRILSRPRDDGTRAGEAGGGHEITSRGGEHSDVVAAPSNVGTTVEVRNLFFNTPARRKFMKGPGTEFGHIAEMVLKLALPHPHIEFVVSHNGRASLKLPRTTLEERLLAAWPDSFREQRLPIDVPERDVRLRGLLGLPELAHPTARYQYLYVNGRPVRDKFVGHALKEAYRGLTEPGRNPAAILLIDLPPEDVDVNVHPTKIEVRFRESSRVHGLVMSAVREVLLSHDLTPKAKPRSVEGGSGGGQQLEPVTDGRQNLMRQLAEFFRAPPTGPQQTLDLPHAPPPATAPSPFFDRPAAAPPAETPAPVPHSVSPSPAAPVPVEHRPADPPAAPSADTSPAAEPPSAAVPSAPLATPALQLHNTYLVVETPDGMQIIDQHALHERILFEELFARVTRGPLESQHLLLPIVLRASDRQLDLLDQIRPLLTRLGIDLAPVGPGQIGVMAFPSFLSRLDPADFVASLLERGEQEILDLSDEELLHDVLDMMACKAAVKAGDPLTPRQIEALLAKRHLIDRSSNCPHGRPTTLKLSLRDLEKQFKRTGF